MWQSEESVTEFLTDINVNVAINDIEACHRIGKKDTRIGSTKAIICFVNRKHARQVLYNKKKLSQVKKNNNNKTKKNKTHLTLTIIPFLLVRT